VNEAEELLEVFDDAGNPTGVAKTRAEIHAAGDWHLAFFCWIVRADGELVLQRRSPTKTTFPNRFDASAAGHVRFGETTAQAMREIEEELGLVVREEELVSIGRHRQVHHHPGIVCREHHDVYLLRRDDPFTAYRPNEEVSGLLAVPARALVELVADRLVAIETELFTSKGHARFSLTKPMLVPYDVAYHERIATAAEALLGT
jgi:isopentenyldiphosphate isomerase